MINFLPVNRYLALILLLGMNGVPLGLLNADDNDEYHRFASAELMAKNTLFDRMSSTVAIGCQQEKNKMGEICNIDLAANKGFISSFIAHKLVSTYDKQDDIIELAKCNAKQILDEHCKPYLTNLGQWMKDSIIALKVQETIKRQIDRDYQVDNLGKNLDVK